MPKRPLRRGFGCSWLEANRDSGRGSKLVLTPALTLALPGEGIAGGLFRFFDCPSGQSRRGYFQRRGNDSPSPWGEGRDEGGRNQLTDGGRISHPIKLHHQR